MSELERLKKLVRNYECLIQVGPVSMSIVNEYVKLRQEIERKERWVFSGDNNISSPVTHWMPLPGEPKGE